MFDVLPPLNVQPVALVTRVPPSPAFELVCHGLPNARKLPVPGLATTGSLEYKDPIAPAGMLPMKPLGPILWPPVLFQSFAFAAVNHPEVATVKLLISLQLDAAARAYVL